MTRPCVFVLVVACLHAAGSAARADAPAIDRIDRVEVRGNRRIETSAIRDRIGSVAGHPLDPARVRADLHAIWALGVFEDVRADTELVAGGRALVFEVTERPAIRKVLVAGNDAVELDAIDDVHGLRRAVPADPAAIRRARDAIAELYAQRGFALATVAAELVPAGAAEVDVRFTIEEHAQIRIRDVAFAGNHALSDAELRGAIATRRRGARDLFGDAGIYRRDVLERDLAVLSAHYLDAGFATAQIGAPAVRLSRDKRFAHVTIPVEEGPRFAFGAIELRGDLLEPAAAARARLASRTGATFSRALVARDREALERRYRDRGYAFASVVPRVRVDLEHRRVAIAFEIVRGKRTYVERIAVRGNARTRDKVIRRELKLAEGELYSATKLEQSRRRVLALGHFDSVAISTARGSSDEFIAVTVEVRERRTGTLQLGAGLSSVEAFIVQGQIGYDNFLGRGHALSAHVQVSRLRRIFGFRFVEPSLFDTPWTFALELYNRSQGFGAFSRDATGGALSWGRRLSDHVHASVTYRLEHAATRRGSGVIANFGARTTSLPELDTADLFRSGMTSSLRGALAWDSRDDRLRPTRGWYATAFAEYAGRLTGSEHRFARWGGFVRRYHPLPGPFVLRLNAQLGWVTSLDGRGVPLSERYLLGGIYDVRGYQPRSLGPKLLAQRPGDIGLPLDELPLGGNLELVGNAEIEFPIARRLGLSGVVFFDLGNAFNLERAHCAAGRAVDACASPLGVLGGLRKSFGAGVRWLSPIGPLRFEWGIPLDLRPGEQASGLDFTIGTSF